ncbi:hypothetical protein [Alteraurantiacibacter buctensis]|uniref:Uncharacterized protein n=1 Tax=Alteraurantiacibacter buctensis TaxID=1503981 RepID=A0A844Z3C4_9SPHN|nr:hypothetical protein [Alteraurantiacibacter buctensis]MXO72373.1 hypothetical protein [Alteraurantiacibacter buctensis]
MDDWSTQIADPAAVMVGLAALIGLVAARSWWKVSQSFGVQGKNVVKARATSHMREAAFLTAGAIGLASAGYLFRIFFMSAA